jgi:GT2 family glycosyltransferase
VLESIRGCLSLDYGDFRVALLPDAAVELPAEFAYDRRIAMIPTGDVTIGAKRNIAIRRFLDAAYIALIDSDAYPDADWLKNGISFLGLHPDVWAVGGPNLTPPAETFLQRVVGNAKQSVLVSGPLHFARKRSLSRFCSNLHSCNLILPRSVFDRLGGFDEALFSGEDRNLCDRIRAAGGRIYFERGVVVYHHNRSLWRPFINQCLTYGHGSRAINARAGNRFNVLLYLPLVWMALFITVVLVSLVHFGSLWPVLLFILACVIAALIEAVRFSRTVREVLHTLAAILVSYLAQTIGQLMAMAGVEPDLKRLYADYPIVSASRRRSLSP